MTLKIDLRTFLQALIAAGELRANIDVANEAAKRFGLSFRFKRESA
jgi:hypothetical protein